MLVSVKVIIKTSGIVTRLGELLGAIKMGIINQRMRVYFFG